MMVIAPLMPIVLERAERVDPPRNRHERRALEALQRPALRTLRALHVERHQLQRAARLKRSYDVARLAAVRAEIDILQARLFR